MDKRIEPNKTIKLRTLDLSMSLFGKRISTPMTNETEMREMLLPDWKDEEYLKEQSAHAQTLYNFIMKPNYKSRMNREVEKFFNIFNYIQLYDTLFKAKGDHKLSIETTKRFVIEYFPKRSLVFNYGMLR